MTCPDLLAWCDKADWNATSVFECVGLRDRPIVRVSLHSHDFVPLGRYGGSALLRHIAVFRTYAIVRFVDFFPVSFEPDLVLAIATAFAYSTDPFANSAIFKIYATSFDSLQCRFVCGTRRLYQGSLTLPVAMTVRGFALSWPA